MNGRIFRVVKEIWNEYISVDEEYTYIVDKGQVMYKRTTDGAGSFMDYWKFKRCLSDGSIVFVDNL